MPFFTMQKMDTPPSRTLSREHRRPIRNRKNTCRSLAAACLVILVFAGLGWALVAADAENDAEALFPSCPEGQSLYYWDGGQRCVTIPNSCPVGQMYVSGFRGSACVPIASKTTRPSTTSTTSTSVPPPIQIPIPPTTSTTTTTTTTSSTTTTPPPTPATIRPTNTPTCEEGYFYYISSSPYFSGCLECPAYIPISTLFPPGCGLYTIVVSGGNNPVRDITPHSCPAGQFFYTSSSWFSGCLHCPGALPTTVAFPIECRGHTHTSMALPSLPEATNKYGERICRRFEPVINCAPQPHPNQDEYGEVPLFPTGRPPYDIYDYGIPRPLPRCSIVPEGTACTPTDGHSLTISSLLRGAVSLAQDPVVRAVLCLASNNVPNPGLNWVIGTACGIEGIRVAILYDNRQVFPDQSNKAAYLRWIDEQREELRRQLRLLEEERERAIRDHLSTTTTLPLCPTEFPASGCTTTPRAARQQTAATHIIPIAPLVSLPSNLTILDSTISVLPTSDLDCQTDETPPQVSQSIAGVCLVSPIQTTTTSTSPPLPSTDTETRRQPQSQSDCPDGTYIQGLDSGSFCKPCSSHTWHIKACLDELELTASSLSFTETSSTSTSTTIPAPPNSETSTILPTP